MVSGKVRIKNPTGLHLRPAGLFCRTAMQFESKITVHKKSRNEDVTANAKSVLSVLGACVKSGDEIVIEERPAEEVTEMWYAKRMAPEGVKVNNPAFDVTDHSLVTGIITEKGIAYAPFDKAFEKLGIK